MDPQDISGSGCWLDSHESESYHTSDSEYSSNNCEEESQPTFDGNDCTLWTVGSESCSEGHTELRDNPEKNPHIDISELVQDDFHSQLCPAESGFVNNHQPSELELKLLKGQQYVTWNEFNKALDEYEAKAGWSFTRFARNKTRFMGKCRGFDVNDPHSCKAELYVRHMKESGRICIQKSYLIHTCSQSSHKWRHGAHKRRWVEEKVQSNIRVNPNTSNKDLRGHIRDIHSADTTVWTAQRARRKVIQKLGGDHGTSFQMIPAYVAKLKHTDPGSHVLYETYETDNQFRRIFMAPASSQNAFIHVRPFVGMDATHTGGEFPMIILLATTFDCNNHILLLAWAIVGVENKENWIWFMAHLDRSYPRMRMERETVIVSDRDKGLIPAVQTIWGDIHHSFCTRHIKANVVSNSDKALGDWFLKLARQVRKSEFDRMLDEYQPLNDRQEAGIRYIQAIDPKLYSRHAFPVPRWGHTTSNVVEILNGVIKPIRKLPALLICKELWDYTMTKHYNRAIDAASENRLTQHATWMLNTLYTKAGGVDERPSSATTALMCDSQGQWALDVKSRHCECKDWVEMGFPCVFF